MSKTQSQSGIKSREIEVTEFLHANAIAAEDKKKKVTGVFEVTPKHIEGTQLCEVQLPCKYKDKNVTIAVYE
jgi:hypothetical protein